MSEIRLNIKPHLCICGKSCNDESLRAALADEKEKRTEANARILKLILERDGFKMEAEKRWALRTEIERLLGVVDSYDDAEKEKAIKKIKSIKEATAEKEKELARAAEVLIGSGRDYGDIAKEIQNLLNENIKLQDDCVDISSVKDARIVELEKAITLFPDLDNLVRERDAILSANRGFSTAIDSLQSSLSSARENLEEIYSEWQADRPDVPLIVRAAQAMKLERLFQKAKKALSSPPPSAAQGGDGDHVGESNKMIGEGEECRFRHNNLEWCVNCKPAEEGEELRLLRRLEHDIRFYNDENHIKLCRDILNELLALRSGGKS